MLKSTPNNPVPEGATAGFIKTSDRIELRYAHWPPHEGWAGDGVAEQPSRGTVALFTGRTEFIEKYYEVIEDLRRRGFHVATLDWRGQGNSQRLLKKGWKGHVKSFRHYERDMDAFIKQVVLPDCPPPYFALAHSMGGMVTFGAAANGPSVRFERIVLSAPMLHINWKSESPRQWVRYISGGVHWQRLFRRLSGFLVATGFGRIALRRKPARFSEAFEGNKLTSDPVRYKRMMELVDEHEDLAIASPTIRWFHSACNAMRRSVSEAHIKRIKVPILIVAAGNDPIVDTDMVEKVARKMRVGKHIVVGGALHEVLFERDVMRDQFWAAFDQFIPGSDPMNEARKVAFAANEE